MLLENVLEVLDKMKIQKSAQFQTVLAVYGQGMDQDRAMPSNQRLKTMERRHIDQMTRTRNFKALNGQESQREKRWSREESGRLLSVEKQLDSVQEETHVVSATEPIADTEHNRPLLAPKAQTQTYGRKPSKGFLASEERVLLERNAGKRATDSSEENVRNRRVIFGILPRVSITSLNRDANMATVVNLGTLRLVGSPVISLRKVVGKDQLPY